jgi:hypothetical protein
MTTSRQPNTSTFRTSCPHCHRALVGSIATKESSTEGVASVVVAAREQGGGGKPQKRTKSKLCEARRHDFEDGISMPCRRCGRTVYEAFTERSFRGAPQPKRSPRSR